MKKIFKFLLSLTLISLIVSCDPPKETVEPAPVDSSDEPRPSTEAVTPVGEPEGTTITAVIGPDGGTIESADKRIRITIPTGALTSSQTITVQPVSNHCPAGTGQAFRLMPHGITFAKPSTITFQYNDMDITGSAPEFLSVAYQNDKGSWEYLAIKSLDTTAHTLTVQTAHFSDWGLFQKMFIHPENSFLNPGENLHLQVFQAGKPEILEGEIPFVPLPTPVPAKHIEKWTLNGGGVLTPQGSGGDYQAPSSIPAINPAAVTVFLNKKVTDDGQVFSDIRLVSNIFVAPEGISVQIDGGGWRTYPGGANINSTQNVILGRDGSETASVLWKGAPTGTFHWTKSANVAFNLNKGKLIYQHIYGKSLSVSGGSLMVDNSDKIWVVGSFTVQPAGWINLNTNPLTIGTAGIKGVFRVKRVTQPL